MWRARHMARWWPGLGEWLTSREPRPTPAEGVTLLLFRRQGYYVITMPSIEELKQAVVAFRDSRDWKQFHKPKDCAISLMLEAAEVAELFQWKNEGEMKDLLINKREELGDELADVLYWILLMSNDFGIDLEEAWDRKMLKNEIKYPVEKSKGNHKKYTEL